ncbi:Uncharacterised protein [Vibrio cholerae]|nr:Uncharacterised protein [Vibrio cholerae]CSD18581.1 Uncharacterised protein [Vibrio cholerae]CSI37162.1 Uncharacterised protein [Vibrio cholerae]CSI72921.1 Uncharacterised protein [Vibrio cholerae]
MRWATSCSEIMTSTVCFIPFSLCWAMSVSLTLVARIVPLHSNPVNRFPTHPRFVMYPLNKTS